MDGITTCANCGAEVPPGTGAQVQVSFRGGSGLKTAVLCDECAERIPGQRAETAGATGDQDHKKHQPMHGSLEAALHRVPARHERALRWFAEREGREISWPRPLADGTLLACRPKGIYKPAWSTYALSVRESLSRRYPDKEPVVRKDGSWTYEYSQENPNRTVRESFANAGLLACMEDDVPVGVFRQVASNPTRYRVLGVAFVREWRGGYFELESPS